MSAVPVKAMNELVDQIILSCGVRAAGNPAMNA
jgi:hypothetical protein